MPEELWMEVCDIVQETGIKTPPGQPVVTDILFAIFHADSVSSLEP